ncbi:MAG TPA: ribonuclease P protein component [Parafilimonas sp.]|nr:ribonuclease P protein component [Parafilimonas sp.]
MKQFTYSKTEKLKSRKQTEELFNKGKSFTIFPLRVVYLQVEQQEGPAKAGVGVSSRNFAKAVQRNRIKRLLREGYRTEKIPLYHHLQNTGRHLTLFLLYIDKQMPEYVLVKEKMRLVIQRLIKELSETGS